LFLTAAVEAALAALCASAAQIQNKNPSHFFVPFGVSRGGSRSGVSCSMRLGCTLHHTATSGNKKNEPAATKKTSL